jgi:hypothetical protein
VVFSGIPLDAKVVQGYDTICKAMGHLDWLYSPEFIHNVGLTNFLLSWDIFQDCCSNNAIEKY